MSNSVQMFNGMDPDRRSSSKVLRPPGGGSSISFGNSDNSEEVPGENSNYWIN